MTLVTNFIDDYELLTQYPCPLSHYQVTQIEDSLLYRIIGAALAVFTTITFLCALSTLSVNQLGAGVLLLLGTVSGIASHDFICLGENMREIVRDQELFANDGLFENVANMARGVKVLFQTVTSGYPYEIHNTLVFKYIWKLQNPALL